MPQSTFSFVTLSGNPTIKKREDVRTVKSHVMRRIHEGNQEARARRRERIRKGVRVRYCTKRIERFEGDEEEKSRGGSAESEGALSVRSDSLGAKASDLVEICEGANFEEMKVSRIPGDGGGKVYLFDVYEDEAATSQTIVLQNTTYPPPFLGLKDNNLFPYQCLSIPATPRIIELLQYDLKSTIRTSVHADPAGLYFDHYADDPARIYVTIAHAALRSSRLTLPWASSSSSSTVSYPALPNYHGRKGVPGTVVDEGWEREGIYYFSKAIAILNENLSDGRKRASDNMIACVSMFANMENLVGSPENATIHIAALQRMVGLRGGLDKLGMKGILRRLVLWSDLLYSIRTQTLPRFPFQHVAPNISVPECLSPTHLPRRFTSSQALLSLSTAQSINIFAILEALNDLATLLNAYPNGVGQELPTSIQYPDRVYVTEHEIVSILYTKSEMPVVNEEATSSRIIVEIFLHACLLYIYTNLRQTPVGGAMRRTLSARLKSCIQRAIDLDALLDEFSTEMLWVCMMGLATAGDNEFWILVMNRICSRKSRQTWSDIEKELLNMPVLERVFEESCHKVWRRSFRGSRFDSEEATQNLDMLAYA